MCFYKACLGLAGVCCWWCLVKTPVLGHPPPLSYPPPYFSLPISIPPKSVLGFNFSSNDLSAFLKSDISFTLFLIQVPKPLRVNNSNISIIPTTWYSATGPTGFLGVQNFLTIPLWNKMMMINLLLKEKLPFWEMTSFDLQYQQQLVSRKPILQKQNSLKWKEQQPKYTNTS